MSLRQAFRWLADAVAIAGIVAFGFLVFGHLHGQVSVIDEGLYLVKGLFFARGEYVPFQDYGPLTNHMPLAFLIPGWVQTVWGEGIRTGRSYALALGLAMALLLWRTARREGSPWWAAAAVWAVALNGALVKIYSQATSQVLVITLLMTVLFLGLGRSRKPWQRAAAAGVAGLLWMTRINLLPVLPLLVGYFWLSHGRRAALAAAMTGGGVVLLGHALYWPEILKLWAKWLPAAWTPFLDRFRVADGGIEAWSTKVSAGSARGILLDAFRKHFVPVAGAVWAALCYPGSPATPEQEQRRRDVVFLGAVMVVLAGIHGYATLGLTYCPWCLANYFGFFSPVGLVMLAIAGAHWLPHLGPARRMVSAAFLLVLPSAVGQGLKGTLVDSILAMQVPRASFSAIRTGTIELGNLLQTSLEVPRPEVGLWLLRGWVAAAVLLAGVVILTFFVARFRTERVRAWRRAAVVGLVCLVLAPWTIRYGNTYAEYDCGLDVIQSEEDAGAYLRDRIEPGALVYWGAQQSPAPLLYLDRPSIFPPQLNGIYTFRLGGNPRELERFGYWNQALAEQWLNEADFVVVDLRAYTGWIAEALDPKRYDQSLPSPPTNPCGANSAVIVFRRIHDSP